MGNVVSDPYGWTGTIRFSIATGSFTLTLDTGTGTNGGTASASLDTSGNLVIQFADGTTQTVLNPLNEFIDSPGGSGTPPSPTPTATPTPAPTPTAPPSNAPYQIPMILNGFVTAPGNAAQPAQMMNNAGVLVGGDNSSGSYVLPPPYTTPQYLTKQSSTTLLFDLQIDDAGEILALTGNNTYVYYSSASAAPQTFTGGRFPAILSAGGKVVSGNPNGQQINYQRSLSATPTVLKGGFSPNAISGDGQMVGRGLSGSTYAGVYISGPDADPVILPNPYGANYYDPEPKLINNAGLIIGQINAVSGVTKQVVWASPTAMPTEVPGIGFANSLNNSGQAVGYETATGGWLYQNGAITRLNDLIAKNPASGVWDIRQATAINDAGLILAEGTFTPAGTITPERHSVLLKPR